LFLLVFVCMTTTFIGIAGALLLTFANRAFAQ
jgi:hypothetical protein